MVKSSYGNNARGYSLITKLNFERMSRKKKLRKLSRFKWFSHR
uniref:Uncharacterized protein n=1 Tax=Rhizophora mucronata TaxID=61149 RepID=A0A2P2QF27_RHIMU